jgi:electron transfer flavoprotein alpha subunit
MKAVVVFSENLNLAAQLINIAASLGAPVCPVAIDAATAERLAEYPVAQVFLLKGASSRPEDYARPLAHLVQTEDPSLLLVGDTVQGREVSARAAAFLDAGLVAGAAEIKRVNDHVETSRMMYGGAVLKTESLAALTVVTVPSGKAEAAKPSGQHAPVVVREVDSDPRVAVVTTAPLEQKGSDLTTAANVVGVGMGIENSDDLALAAELARALNAAMGCTRPVAEERDLLPGAQYIGISGVTISPSLYITVGISGQVQHTVGIRDAKCVVAIDKNEKAPIFKSADYGIVGDLRVVVPLLTRAVQSR